MAGLAHALLALGVLTFAPIPAQAQSAVLGRVVDGDRSPVSLANVQLRVHADSPAAHATISDAEGRFLLTEVDPGSYRVHVSRIGYRSATSDELTIGEGERLRVPPLVMEPEAIEIAGVSAQARRSLYQQRPDRLVINIGSSSTLAGASALQVLERSPGVVVDKVGGSISLLGKSGVRLLINGKLSYIPADALLQYLSGLSADNIERIELITSPPASLDAEGDAGYIDLVLKRPPDGGLNGSLSASGGYGEGEIGSASVNLRYEGSPLSIYGSYSFLWDAQKQFISNFRRVAGAEGLTEMPGSSWRDPVQRNNDARVGIEYRIDERTRVGALVAGYDNRWSMEALNRLTIEKDGAAISRIDSDNDEVNHWRHAMANLNLERAFDGGAALRVDLDYLRYANDNPTVYLNNSTNVATGQETQERVESGKVTPLGILVAKADYRRASGSWTLETGVKGAFSRFENEASLTGVADQPWVTDAGFGTRTTLHEDILAAYASADYSPDEVTTVKAGLRYELTDSNLGSDVERDIVDRRFGNLFPSVAVSRGLTEDHKIDVSYTRRITRPSFADMAPFLYFFDPNTFFSGNAALQPAISNTVKLQSGYRSLIASLQYAWEDSTIARFQSRFVPEYDIHVIFPANLRSRKTATGVIAAPVGLASWWTTQNNAMVVWQEVRTSSDQVTGRITSTSYRLNSTQNIRLPGRYSLEGTGFYQSPSLFGAMRFGATWQVNAAIQARLPNDAKLTLRADDIFDSFQWEWTTGTPDAALYIDQVIDFGARTISLVYSMSFGGGAGSEPSTASEEERQRVR